MDKVIKEIIDSIDKQPLTIEASFGYNVSNVLFRKGEKALLRIDGKYCLLLGESIDAAESTRMLLELFSYLRDMEKEHIIYVQQSLGDKDSFLFYEECKDLRWSQASQRYNMGDNCYLKELKGQFQIFDNGNVVLKQAVNLDFLSDEIEQYLCSLIYPTNTLKRFIKQGYLSDNDYYNNEAQSLSRKSIIVALIIACVSPIVTLLLSNQWGVTTIIDSQYSSIGEVIELQKQTKAKDSVIIGQLDSVLKVIDRYEQDSVKFIQGK